MTKSTTAMNEVGKILSGFILNSLGNLYPSVAFEKLPEFEQLREGDVSSLRRLRIAVTDAIKDYQAKSREQPFYGNPQDVAKRLVGTQIVYFDDVLRPATGIVTRVAAYSEEGKPVEFTLPSDKPGTIGYWSGTGR